MGYSQDRMFAKNPQIKQLWEEYILCRQQEILVFRRPEKGNKERQITAIWTTGFAQLPDAGGVRDQGFLTIRVFSAFLEGERQGQLRRMQK